MRDALQRGYRPGTFVHHRWYRPYWGLRSKTPTDENLRDRALQYVPRLRPGERFSHGTALALLDCPIWVPKAAAIDVSSPRPQPRVQCRGVVGHSHAADSLEYPCALPDRDDWIPVSPALVAVQQAAGSLPFTELVVALDHLLKRDSRRFDPHVQVDLRHLARTADTVTGRGAARFRMAAALARMGAESRMETFMRLGAESVGLTELELQSEIYDRSGSWIGRFDAADRETRTLYEYDGEQHFYLRAQRRRDPKKLQAAYDAGWRVLVFYSEDLACGVLDVGRRMLEFSGREPRPISVRLSRLLEERSDVDTESAIPLSLHCAGGTRV